MKKIHNKRRASWIDILLTFSIFTLIVGGGYLLFSSKNNETHSPSKNKGHTASASSTVDTIASNYPGIKIITEISNDSEIPFAIQYPQSTHETFNKKIKSYIKKVKNSYLTEITEYKQVGGEITGELNISFETYVHHSGLYSFVLLSNRYVGGANGTTEIHSFRFHPETGESTSIEEVFEHDIDRLVDVTSKVQEQLNNDPALKDYLFPEEVTVHTEPIWRNFRNFALTEDTIVFYFNEYEIAAGAAGVPIVSIPLINLDSLLAPEFKVQDEEKSEDVLDKPTSPTKEEEVEQEDRDVETTSPGKRVALTFDDGPEPIVTMQILETLKKYDAKATFFMLGSRVEYYPDIAKNVQAAGHELGNHTWNHPDLTKANEDKISNEINRTSTIIEEVTGQKATLFRPPYGAFNDTVSTQSDLPIILWDVDTLDWKHRSPNQLLAYVKQQTNDGSIILMHDIHQSTADGLDAVLAYLKNEGYSFVTVSELK